MSFLELDSVYKGYGPPSARSEVLADVNLAVEENEFVAITGFSGSGKSTLMAILAGLQSPDRGEVRLAGKRVTEPGFDRGIMFQNYSLLPWLTVAGNIELAIRQASPELRRRARKARTHEYIDLVSLTGAGWKRPHELSGGMRQRVALARTLAMRPKVLLLDEPLSALDALTRATLQDEIIRLWEHDRRTVVMITNDVDEAALMADRIVPLTVGPEATLARAFPVSLERPRDRSSLSFNPDFKKLRAHVTEFMLTMRREQRERRLRLADHQPGQPSHTADAAALAAGHNHDTRHDTRMGA